MQKQRRLTPRHLEAVLAKGPVVDVEVPARLESEEEHGARPVPPARRRLQGTMCINTSQAGTRHTHARQADARLRTSSTSCSLRSSLA